MDSGHSALVPGGKVNDSVTRAMAKFQLGIDLQAERVNVPVVPNAAG
jgi:hypothetical protein